MKRVTHSQLNAFGDFIIIIWKEWSILIRRSPEFDSVQVEQHRFLFHLSCTGPALRSFKKSVQTHCLQLFDMITNRNLKISKALLKSQAHQGTSLFTSTATNQRGFFLRGRSREAQV